MTESVLRLFGTIINFTSSIRLLLFSYFVILPEVYTPCMKHLLKIALTHDFIAYICHVFSNNNICLAVMTITNNHYPVCKLIQKYARALVAVVHTFFSLLVVPCLKFRLGRSTYQEKLEIIPKSCIKNVGFLLLFFFHSKMHMQLVQSNNCMPSVHTTFLSELQCKTCFNLQLINVIWELSRTHYICIIFKQAHTCTCIHFCFV